MYQRIIDLKSTTFSGRHVPPASVASGSVESRNSQHIGNRKWPEYSTKANQSAR